MGAAAEWRCGATPVSPPAGTVWSPGRDTGEDCEEDRSIRSAIEVGDANERRAVQEQVQVHACVRNLRGDTNIPGAHAHWAQEFADPTNDEPARL